MYLLRLLHLLHRPRWRYFFGS